MLWGVDSSLRLRIPCTKNVSQSPLLAEDYHGTRKPGSKTSGLSPRCARRAHIGRASSVQRPPSAMVIHCAAISASRKYIPCHATGACSGVPLCTGGQKPWSSDSALPRSLAGSSFACLRMFSTVPPQRVTDGRGLHRVGFFFFTISSLSDMFESASAAWPSLWHALRILDYKE